MAFSTLKLLLAALFLVPAAVRAQDGAAILERTAQAYAGLDAYRMAARIAVDMAAGENRQAMNLDVRLAARGAEHRRIEVTGPDMDLRILSDGDSTWTYMPAANQYIAVSGGLNPNSLAAAVPDLLGEYTAVGDRVATVERLREEVLRLGDASYPTYVLAVAYSPAEESDSLSGTWKTLWIDRDRHIVLRDSTHARIEETPYGVPMVVDEVTEFHTVSIGGPLPDSLFTFAPPAGALRVDAPKQETPSSPLEGQPAVNFELESLGGTAVSLESLRGKVVLVNFWATWCGPCRVEMPMLQSLYTAHRDEGMEVLAVAVGETREDVAPYVEARGFTFPVLLDESAAIGDGYLAYSIPMSVIIDREGTIVRHFYGVRTEAWLLQALREAGLGGAE